MHTTHIWWEAEDLSRHTIGKELQLTIDRVQAEIMTTAGIRIITLSMLKAQASIMMR